MNTSTTAQCGSEIVGRKELMDIHAENFQLRSELTRLRNENSGLANKALSLQSELAAARKALEDVTRTAALLQQNAIGCAEHHHGVDTELNGLPGWLKDTKASIDRAYAALSSKEPEGK